MAQTAASIRRCSPPDLTCRSTSLAMDGVAVRISSGLMPFPIWRRIMSVALWLGGSRPISLRTGLMAIAFMNGGMVWPAPAAGAAICTIRSKRLGAATAEGGRESISAVRLDEPLEPDYRNCRPEDRPYD